MRGVHRSAYKAVSDYGKRPGVSYIYALTESGAPPVCRKIRYIGKTNQKPITRLYHHLSDRGQTYRERWIKRLIESGKEPKMHILAIVPTEYAAKAEVRIIAAAKNKGAPLCNLTEGGEGTPGHLVSDETKKKISAANKGKPGVPKSPEHLAAISEAGKKRWAKPGERERHSAMMKLVEVTAERRRKISEALTGKRMPEVTREKVRAANIGRKASVETRKKMSASQFRRNRPSVLAQHKFYWGGN